MSATAPLEASELRGHSEEELKRLEGSLQEDLFKLRMQRYTNQLENTMQIRQVRRNVARVKTVLRARALGLPIAKAQPDAPAELPSAEATPKKKQATQSAAKSSGKRAASPKTKTGTTAKTKRPAGRSSKSSAKAKE